MNQLFHFKLNPLIKNHSYIRVIGMSLVINIFLLSAIVQAEDRVAILPFKNSSVGDKYSSLVNSIPDMLMTELFVSGEISIVERIQIEKALKNFAIEQTGLIDETTAIKIGEWLGATLIIVGNFLSHEDTIRIDARVIDVSTGKLKASSKSEGNDGDLLEMINDLSLEIRRFLTQKGIFCNKIIEFTPDELNIDESVINLGSGPQNGQLLYEIQDVYNPKANFRIMGAGTWGAAWIKITNTDNPERSYFFDTISLGLEVIKSTKPGKEIKKRFQISGKSYLVSLKLIDIKVGDLDAKRQRIDNVKFRVKILVE